MHAPIEYQYMKKWFKIEEEIKSLGEDKIHKKISTYFKKTQSPLFLCFSQKLLSPYPYLVSQKSIKK